MKSSFVFLAAAAALLVAAEALGALQCCRERAVISRRGRCQEDGGKVSNATLNCNNGRWILKDAFLVGNKVYSADAPNFVFVEDPTQYCLGTSYRNFTDPTSGLTPSALICFEATNTNAEKIQATGILSLVSVIFLVFTLVVYLYLPQMRDLQGMCYITLCISMGLGFLFLGIMQLNPGFAGEDCTATGFAIYFWMIATFFWMNIISINTYRSIVDASYVKRTEKQQYLWYSIYGWGATFVLLIVALITNYAAGDHLKPGFSKNSCWINGKTETWAFFYGPIAVLIMCNIALFLLSSKHLWTQNRKYEVNKLNVLRHKFLLSLKLFLVMGVSWIFEIASFAHGESFILWTIMDIFNCLQGVVIFLLLVVLRRRAVRGLVDHNFLTSVTKPLAEKLSPHDEEDEEVLSADDTMEVRLN